MPILSKLWDKSDTNFWGLGMKPHRLSVLSMWDNNKCACSLWLLTSKNNRTQLRLLLDASWASSCFYCYCYTDEINNMENPNANWQQLTHWQPNEWSLRWVRVERFQLSTCPNVRTRPAVRVPWACLLIKASLPVSQRWNTYLSIAIIFILLAFRVNIFNSKVNINT